MAAGCAPVAERLYSLELLVGWVRLEPRLLPPPPPPEEQEEPPPPGSLRLAVAFRLLDFPTLLVYPPGGPDAPSRGRTPGSFPFGRGKSCLFRLDAATLQRLLGASPLYALLLTVPPGSPTPAPKLLGSCSISLAPAARALLREGGGPSATGASQGQRALYVLRDLMGEQVGHICLGYRLTDLGSTLLGHLPPKAPGARPREEEEEPAGAGLGPVRGSSTAEGGPPAPQGREPRPPPRISPAQVDPEDLEDWGEPEQQEEVIEIVTYDQTKPKPQQYVVEILKAPSKCSRSDIDTELTDSSRSETSKLNEVGESISPNSEGGAELDLETNIICPPPLFYSHLEPKKVPPAKGKFISVPRISEPGEPNDVVPREKPPCPLVMNHDAPSDQSHSAAAQPQPQPQPQPEQGRLFDQEKLDTIRQLPLLNALLLELSLLYNQPVASASGIHPHLAWLYRPEDGKTTEPSESATCKSEEVGDKFLPMKEEEVISPPLLRSPVEHNLRKGVCFEPNRSNPKKAVSRRKLFYGLTNTLKLRLKRTNPNMLILHEKREQYRKMQTKMPATEKLKILSSKEKSYTEEHKKPHALPSNWSSASDVLFAENITTLKQAGVESEGQSSTKETHVSETGTEKVMKVEIRAKKGTFGETVTLVKPMLPEKVTPTNVSERFKKEVKVHLLDVEAENARTDNISIDFSNGANQTKGCDFNTLNSNAIKPSKNSSSESIAELKYSDDFTSPCYSEDFSTADDTFGNSRVHDSSPELEEDNLSYSYLDTDCKSSESRMSRKSNRSEINSVLTPPFSAGSPVRSYKKSHHAKSQGKSPVDGNSVSSNDLSSHWDKGKKKQSDQNNIHNTEMRNSQGSIVKLNPRSVQKRLEKSQSLGTSQVSSYLPSNMSELELSDLDNVDSDHFEENDELGSLDISKQYKDICELVINKLPGYTV